jgi:PAS domain S-box-containing protein
VVSSDPKIEPRPFRADDLTETRERLSADLGGNAALLHTLNLHSNISVMDSSGRIIDVNDNFCRISGYAREELLGRPDSLLYSEVQGAQLWAERWRTIRGGQSWRGEICARSKDGSQLWMDSMIAPILGADGKPAIYISIRNDITAAKQTELRLRDTEAFLDRAGQTAGVAGWELDVKTHGLRWSAHMLRIHEVASDYQPALGTSLKFFPPKARSRLKRHLRETIKTGKGCDLELPFLTARGRRLWVRVVAECEFLQGRLTRLVGSLQDITERKRTETSLALERAKMVSLLAQLQTANERFDIASESSGIAIWEYDVRENTLTWDDRMYRLYGIERENGVVTYREWQDRLHPDDRGRYLAEVALALSGETNLQTEFRIVRPDGDVRHVKATAHVARAADGKALRMTGTNVDISGSKQAQLQLFKTSSLLRTILDSAAEIAIIATDPDLTVKVFNAGAERLLGYASEEVVGCATPLRVHEADELRQLSAEVGAKEGRPLAGWEVYVQPSMRDRPHECTFVRRDGRRLRMSQVVTAMHSYEGELLGYLSVSHDVSLQRQHELSLREATSRAEHANSAKSQFLANISHEIRTPMNAVVGLCYLLGRTELSAEQSAFLGQLEVASKSLLAIINDVLDLSKIEAGELLVERTPFCPRALVDEVVDVMRIHADVKGIAFRVAVADTLPEWLEGDPTRLKQILTNLLSNAIRFTDHGSVELRASMEAESAAGVNIKFVVIDTGIGITKDAQTRLFSPFAQADASITRRFGGTGLGLSIVKSLVTALGGELHLESAAGVGTEFTIVLTMSACPAPAAALDPGETVTRGLPGLTGVRVLVADDSDMNLNVVKSILELEGAQVSFARNGREAFDRLQADAHEFDVVLMDVQMPLLNGHDATRLIRSELGLVDLPIIALTADALSSARDLTAAAGSDDFILKPFEAATLVRCIRKYVRVSALRAGTPVFVAPAASEVPMAWPEIDGVLSADARLRLSDDVRLFLSSLARLLVEFSDLTMPAEAQCDLVQQAARMHKLKGSAGMLGAKTIHALASQAETACVGGSWERASEIAVMLSEHMQRLRDSATPVINAARARTDGLVTAEEAGLTPDLLNELAQLLQQQNLSALDRFRCLEPQLRRHLGADRFESLRTHIDALQFTLGADILAGGAGKAPAIDSPESR